MSSSRSGPYFSEMQASFVSTADRLRRMLNDPNSWETKLTLFHLDYLKEIVNGTEMEWREYRLLRQVHDTNHPGESFHLDARLVARAARVGTIAAANDDQPENAAAVAATSAADEQIALFRAENQESTPLHFSRACRVCFTDAPRRRAVLNACGHAVCRACAEQMKKDAPGSRITCPFCRATSDFVPLYEDSTGVQEICTQAEEIN